MDCFIRPDGAAVHVSRPLVHTGRHSSVMVGRTCGCGQILTNTGRPSEWNVASRRARWGGVVGSRRNRADVVRRLVALDLHHPDAVPEVA